MLLCYIYFADTYVHVLMYCFQRALLQIGIIPTKLLSLNKDFYFILFILLIIGYLTPGGKYFMQIQDRDKFNTVYKIYT
jgi:hypothetical protein